jgi:ParB family transcriptional regulator, chromosome partitioning protein
MTKKRRVFDIDFDEAETSVQATSPEVRRGPMASAISENSDALSARQSAEAAIRVENDALAHEHVRLKKAGLITDLIALDKVATTKLTRDRIPHRDEEMDELKDSIREIGLSNPIRVQQTETGYELIQGFRRLSAYRELQAEDGAEDGQGAYDKIPAALVPRGEPLEKLYRKMVDENLVRRDISFGEMARLAMAYAKDAGLKTDEAVSILYASALKQKRTYIRSFARVLTRAHGNILHPEAIPRALGLELYKVFEVDALHGDNMIERLRAVPDRDAATEVSILREFAKQAPKIQPKPARSRAKTTLRLTRPEGEVRVTAADGKIELRMDRDFSAIGRQRLQVAVEAFLATVVSGPKP